jgi:hypothetical protein
MTQLDDPTLTPTERAALARLLVSERKGGAGWHRESPAAAQVRDILEAGRTRDERDERLLETALRLADKA